MQRRYERGAGVGGSHALERADAMHLGLVREVMSADTSLPRDEATAQRGQRQPQASPRSTWATGTSRPSGASP